MAVKNGVKRGFVIKFIFSDYSINLRVNALTVLLFLLLLGGLVFKAQNWYENKIDNYDRHISELEKSNIQYRTALNLKERENQQIITLAENRFEELCSQIENQDNAINSINKTVGKKNSHRKTLRGARMGARHASLELKLKYKKLIDTVSDRNTDITKLRVVVNKYRQSIEAEKKALMMSKIPSMWPVHGEISSDFGSRVHPVYGYSRFHSGLDIAAPSGLPIVSTAAGNVSYVGWMQGYGYAVEVDHGNGLKTLYAHCSQVLVKSGSFVKAGQKIALVGSTGISTGPHCHYEVIKNGNPINPVPYL
ncbi:MAG: peptidoglycan DD-metalloendopeptidase family protein [Candidatus Bruticola sp.]